jgi:hypothetical protein
VEEALASHYSIEGFGYMTKECKSKENFLEKKINISSWKKGNNGGSKESLYRSREVMKTQSSSIDMQIVGRT